VIIWLNGPFGVGKTTVARIIVERLESTLLYDPELFGATLRAVLAPMDVPDDFQELKAWPALVVRTAAVIQQTRACPSLARPQPQSWCRSAVIQDDTLGPAMSDPLHIGLDLAKNSPSLIRNLFGIVGDAQLASNRVLVAEQTRKLAERFGVAPRVIDTLMEQDLEVRSSHAHGIRLELTQPAHGRWSGERVEGTVNISLRNEWVYPATLTKLVASVELPGWKALITVTTWDKDWLIPGRSAHNVGLEWSWLTKPEQLQTTTTARRLPIRSFTDGHAHGVDALGRSGVPGGATL